MDDVRCEVKKAYDLALENVDKFECLLMNCSNDEKDECELKLKLFKEQVYTLRYVLSLFGE